jgi:hypothetical protein
MKFGIIEVFNEQSKPTSKDLLLHAAAAETIDNESVVKHTSITMVET